jgi:hypothetical protein
MSKEIDPVAGLCQSLPFNPQNDVDPVGRRPLRDDGQPTGSNGVGHTQPKKPAAGELLNTPDALLTRTHLRELGLDRRAVDAVFRELPVVVLPGYSRPFVRAADFQALLEKSTYAGDRVRPT